MEFRSMVRPLDLYQYYQKNPSIDGFMVDNVFHQPRVNADWNRDGKTDSQSDAQVGTWYRQGYQQYFNNNEKPEPGNINWNLGHKQRPQAQNTINFKRRIFRRNDWLFMVIRNLGRLFSNDVDVSHWNADFMPSRNLFILGKWHRVD